MTKEERFKMDTIDEFKQMCEIVEKDGRIIVNKQRMLKALEQEPSEDAVSRGKAIYEISVKDGKSEQIEALMQLPSVQPKAKTGRWISEHTGYYRDNYVCSQCGVTKMFIYDELYDYCPNCGARMGVDE